MGSVLGDIQWTSDQAQIISRKNGHDTSSWNVDETKRRPLKRGLSKAPLATRWNTLDNNGRLRVRYYHPFGEGTPAASAARTETSAALTELSRYMNSCIRFVEDTECDSSTDIACVPSKLVGENHVKITCGPENVFDQGCYANLGMIDQGVNVVNLESSSCSSDDNHCFASFSGMGAVHQQFLHALGVVHEHQRPDASTHVTAQRANIALTNDQFTERYGAITLDNWMDTGSGFDFNSVTLYSFYDNNIKSLADLQVNYNSAEYSLIRTSDANNPIWANKYRASTEDIVQLVNMYSDVCSETDLLPRSACPGGSGQQVFTERLCDKVRNDCDDGSDENESCYNNNSYNCCTDLVLNNCLLSNQFGSCVDNLAITKNGWSDLYKRPIYYSEMNGFPDFMFADFYIVPLEKQEHVYRDQCNFHISSFFLIFFNSQ